MNWKTWGEKIWIKTPPEGKQYICSISLHHISLCRHWGLWLSNIDEEQSEEWCNGVLERERAAGWRMEPIASLRVSAGASRMITSAPLSFQHHAAVSVVFTAELSSHNLTSHHSLSSPFPSCCPSSSLLSSSLTFSQTRVPDLSCWLDTRMAPCCCGT